MKAMLAMTLDLSLQMLTRSCALTVKAQAGNCLRQIGAQVTEMKLLATG